MKGLTSHEAEKLLKQYGLNAIEPPQKPGFLAVFLSQFNNFLSILLIIAAVLAIGIGESIDGGLIVAIVILNGLFGVYQEKKAEAAIEALSQISVTKVRVIRDGEEKEIDSRYLVPGDIIYLEEGSKVASDATLIDAISLEVNESTLTGESLPVPKTISEEIFMGTIIAKGRGHAEVIKTGSQTKFGKIAANLSEINEPKTPLQKKLESLSKSIGIIGIVASMIVFFLSRSHGTSLFEAFLLAVSLAVAVVPEGLPAVLTMTLAIGVKEMAKRNAIVRKLSAVEAFGSVTLIATDKTGTLTTNKMRVKELYINQKIISVTAELSGTSLGLNSNKGGNTPPLQQLLLCGIVCSTASLVPVHELRDSNTDKSYDILGDPTEGAALILAEEIGMHTEDIRSSWTIVDEMPFDSVTKRMSVVVEKKDDLHIYAKGAPESILAISHKIMMGDKEEILTSEKKAQIEQTLSEWGRKGLRVLAFAYKPIHKTNDQRFTPNDLIFIGMIGIHDAPRPEVRDAILKAHAAGIRVVMITGDNETTAEAIATHVGLMKTGDEIINGSQLERYSDEELLAKLDKVTIFARTTPFHKQRIVGLFQKMGEIVAVTGDGVNDSIALKQADVGLAMGIIGTDVARETADIVIADDNFATIVNAIEEGRNIIKNVKNAIIYLLSCNIAEALALIIGLLVGLPPLFLPIQLLYINLITDGVPALALAYSPHEEHLMKEPPKKSLALLQKTEFIRIFSQGLLATVFVLGTYYLYSSLDGTHSLVHPLAVTAAFTVLALIQSFIFVDTWLEHRSLFTHTKRLKSGAFWTAFILPFIGQTAILYIPFLAKLFKIVSISSTDYLFLIVVSSLILVTVRFIPAKS